MTGTAAAPPPARSIARAFWPLQIAGWAAYFVMVVATFLPMIPAGASVWPLVRVKIARTLIGFTLTSGLRFLLRRVAAGRLGLAAGVAIPAAAVLGIVWVLLGALVATIWGDDVGRIDIDWSRAPREALDYALTIVAWSALYFGVTWSRDLEAARAGALEARALAQQAQLDALRYQLNPHFLFNALNSIRALIDEDRGRARHMVTALSEFLRYPMLGERRAAVPLGEEMAAVRHYLAIEAIRFEGRLEVTFDVADDLQRVEVPGLLLHPLVENAVKHGMMTPGPLAIGVEARREPAGLLIRITNSGAWREAANGHAASPPGTGTGLRNVRARLARLTPSPGTLTIDRGDGRVGVSVHLPLPV